MPGSAFEEIRWVIKDTTGVDLPPPPRKTIDAEGTVIVQGVVKAVREHRAALADLTPSRARFAEGSHGSRRPAGTWIPSSRSSHKSGPSYGRSGGSGWCDGSAGYAAGANYLTDHRRVRRLLDAAAGPSKRQKGALARLGFA